MAGGGGGEGGALLGRSPVGQQLPGTSKNPIGKKEEIDLFTCGPRWGFLFDP